MKNISIPAVLLLMIVPILLQAQLKPPPALQDRLQTKTKFYDIKHEVHEYYRIEKSKLSLRDSAKRRAINRQLKFWNRWFHESESRLEPDGTVANWSKRMFEISQQAGFSMASAQSVDAANSGWTLVGPTNIGNGIGRVLRIGFHPTNASIVYAGTARGGLWKTSNGGASWQAVSSFLPSLGISGIVGDHDNPNTIYVLTGEGDAWLSGGFTFNYGYVSYSNGVFKSTDGGNTWNKTADFLTGINDTRYVGFQLKQDANNANTLLAATSAGVFRTTSGGQSWSAATFFSIDSVTTFNDVGIFDIEYKPNSSSVVYAAGYRPVMNNLICKYFRSTDGGQNFFEIKIGSNMFMNTLIRFEIAVTPAQPNSVFLLCGPGFLQDNDGSNDTFHGFLKSTNSGISFSTLATEPDVFGYNPTIGPTMDNQCWYDIALAVSPTNANNIFTGGLVVFRSTDGGNNFSGNTTYWTWEVGGSNIHPDVHDLQFNPLDGKLYAATDGGVSVTSNNGGSWTKLFTGMSISQFYHSEPDNENGKLWGGTQDNGVMEQSSGGTFTEFDGGDGFDVMTDNVVGNGNDSYWTLNGAMVTTRNTGNSDITPPAPNQENRNFGNMDMHPTNEDYIYVGYNDAVFYSNDQGASWEIDGSTNKLAGGTVKGEWCIQSCPSNASRLYCAGGGRMWRVDGINFDDASTGDETDLFNFLVNDGFPKRNVASLIKINDILVHPSSSLKVWIAASGFSDGNKVFYSEDGGESWQNISYGLPNVPANCLLRNSDGTIYLGTDMGVYYLPSGGNNWIPFYNGLPRVPVTEMNFVFDGLPLTKYIYASTFGRGIWKSQTFTACIPDLDINQNLRGQHFYQTSRTISSTSLVDGAAGTYVLFQSGNNIDLTVGFEGKAGVVFQGYIHACNDGPIPSAATLPEQQTGGQNPAQIYGKVQDIKLQNQTAVLKLVIYSEGDYELQLTDESGTVHQSLPLGMLQPKTVLQKNIPVQNVPDGFYHARLLHNGTTVHFLEMNLKNK